MERCITYVILLPDDQRVLKNGTWVLNSSPVFAPQSDTIDTNQKIYTKNGVFYRSVSVKDEEHTNSSGMPDLTITGDIIVGANGTLNVSEDCTWRVKGNVNITGSWNYSGSYAEAALVKNNGTLDVDGNFKINDHGAYEQTNTDAKLYVGGDFSKGAPAEYLTMTEGTIYFDGAEQQKVDGLECRNIEVTNPEGLKYLQSVYVTGNYDLHGNPLDPNGYSTYISGNTCLTNNEGDNFGSIRLASSFIVGKNMVFNGDIYVGDDQTLTIPEGTSVVVHGDLSMGGYYLQGSRYIGKVKNNGTLDVEGTLKCNDYSEFNQSLTDSSTIADHVYLYSSSYLKVTGGTLTIRSVDTFNAFVDQMTLPDEATLDTRFEVYEAQAMYDALTSYEKTLVYRSNQKLNAVANVVEELIAQLVQDAKHSLALEGNIGVNFYYAFSDEVLADQDARVELTLDDTVTSYLIKDARTRQINGIRYKIFTVEVTSVQMASDIDARLFLSSGDSVFEEKYSVKQYCDGAIAASDSETNLTKLMKALLNYGGYAQIAFDTNTEQLANADLENTDVSDVTAEMLESEQVVTAGSEVGLNYSSSSLALNSLTTINHIFTLDSGHSIDEYEFKLDNQVLTPIKRGSRYYILIENISSNNLDTKYTVSAGDFSITYSALSYAYKALISDAASYELKDLVRAMYKYN